MTQAWRLDLSPTDKMVLLALADAANDDGVCWTALRSKNPEKLDLLTKCSLSERAIQGAIKRLCEAGYLTRTERPGKGVLYHVDPRSKCAPQDVRPAGNDVDPRSSCGETVSNPHTSEAIASSDSARAHDFPIFWEAYPHKVGKAKAKAEWDAARKASKPEKRLPSLAAVLAAVEAYKLAKPEDRAWCNPSTWLHQGRWNDEHTTTPSGQPPPTGPRTAVSNDFLADRDRILEQIQ